eukprot:1004746-Rhodomonas_salina.1
MGGRDAFWASAGHADSTHRFTSHMSYVAAVRTQGGFYWIVLCTYKRDIAFTCHAGRKQRRRGKQVQALRRSRRRLAASCPGEKKLLRFLIILRLGGEYMASSAVLLGDTLGLGAGRLEPCFLTRLFRASGFE